MTNHPNRSKGPMFGRRHWDAMSSLMRRNCPDWVNGNAHSVEYKRWGKMVDDTAVMFAEDNEAFDRAKFVEACSPVEAQA